MTRPRSARPVEGNSRGFAGTNGWPGVERAQPPGGAIAIPLFGLAGGYAMSGRGPLWARVACGVVALVPIPGWALAASIFGGPDFALTSPRRAWIAIFFYSFVATL